MPRAVIAALLLASRGHAKALHSSPEREATDGVSVQSAAFAADT
jgi:hypothetical protein